VKCILSLALLSLASCKVSTPIQQPQTEELANCARILDLLYNAVAMRQLILFGSGCGESLGFGELESLDLEAQIALAGEHGLYCSDTAKEKTSALSPTKKIQSLAMICGAEYYGLPPGQERYFTLDWFFAKKAGNWLSRAREHLAPTAPLLAKLDHEMARFLAHVPLPENPTPDILLPSSEERPRGSAASSYIFLSGETPRTTPAPVVTLDAEGVSLELNFKQPQPEEGMETLGKVLVADHESSAAALLHTVQELSLPEIRIAVREGVATPMAPPLATERGLLSPTLGKSGSRLQVNHSPDHRRDTPSTVDFNLKKKVKKIRVE